MFLFTEYLVSVNSGEVDSKTGSWSQVYSGERIKNNSGEQ